MRVALAQPEENNMIKNVFIDLDDTLLDFHRAEREALSRTLVHFGYEPKAEILDRYNVINASFWKRLETGELDRPAIKRGRYEQLALEFDLKLTPDELNGQYEAELAKGHYYLDGAEKLLSDLRLQGKRIYIATNGAAHIQRSRIASANIAKAVDYIFISQELGYYKPSAEFFQAAFDKVPDLKKEESVMVGDSLTSDIKGGINAGIKTVWYNPDKVENQSGVKPDYEISRLLELPDLLKEI